jgi:hypothetical protein
LSLGSAANFRPSVRLAIAEVYCGISGGVGPHVERKLRYLSLLDKLPVSLQITALIRKQR